MYIENGDSWVVCGERKIKGDDQLVAAEELKQKEVMVATSGGAGIGG